MTRVELFEVIRRDHFLQGKGVRQIARERRIHRRAVRQALQSAVPPPRKAAERDPPVLTLPLRSIVDGFLKGDREAPKKQRHTAHRIFMRLRREHGYVGAESTVRVYVGNRKRELGLCGEAYVPQVHQPGEEADVDWYEAVVDFPTGRQKVNIFQMRACSSGREFHWASPRQDQQALLEGHVRGLGYFGGVFSRLRYDNMRTAIKKILRGRRRIETDRFVALRSHYLFESFFCRPGKEGAPEKGGVECGVGRFRRNHLVPIPKAESYEELNRKLLELCAEDDRRRIQGRRTSVIEDWEAEKAHLRALPEEPFGVEEVSTPRVDGKARILVKTNRYSVPVGLPGFRVEAKVSTLRVDVFHRGGRVASHERLSGRHEERLDLDHYLELLRIKPGALAGSLPLRQSRDAGLWPGEYDRLWEGLKQRHGESEGTRQLVDVLLLNREADVQDVRLAAGLACEYGCFNAGAVEALLRQLQKAETDMMPLDDLGLLSRYDREISRDLSVYDALVVSREGQA